MIYSKLLSRYAELTHGFSTQADGDYREFLGNNRKIEEKIVLAEQVHQDRIGIVKKNNSGGIVKDVDGLLTRDKAIILGLHTADCLPILFFEPNLKIVAAIHAGWQGTLKGITLKAVRKILKLGGKQKNIMAVIGPHIGGCCYDIDEKRVKLFAKKENSQVIKRKNSRFYLDLGEINYGELLKAGILKKNIERFSDCTCCNRNFFSYRRSLKEKGKLAQMLAFIGRL